MRDAKPDLKVTMLPGDDYIRVVDATAAQISDRKDCKYRPLTILGGSKSEANSCMTVQFICECGKHETVFVEIVKKEGS